MCRLTRAAQADISAEALAAAREMGREALVRRLAEIGMSEYDSAVYESFLRPVEQEVREGGGRKGGRTRKRSEGEG